MPGLPYKSIFASKMQIGERTIPGNQLMWSVFHDFPAFQMHSVITFWWPRYIQFHLFVI